MLSHVHSTLVQVIGESLEVVRRAETAVELGSIRNPIAVVGITVGRTGALVVLRDRANPDYARRSRK